MNEFWSLVWGFVNSPVGVSMVSGIVLFLLGKLWKIRPSWEREFDRYRGVFFDAVRYADSRGGKSSDKTAIALKYVLELEEPILLGSKKNLVRGIDRAVDLKRGSKGVKE